MTAGLARSDDRFTEQPAPQSRFERQPPQDLAAEQSVLGGMLLSKDAIADVVETLRSGDFYKPAHSLIFDAVLDLYAKGEPADPITVTGELDRTGKLSRTGGATYLHHLTSMVPTAANAGFYAHIVAEKAILRRLVEAGTTIVQLGYGGADGEMGGGAVDEIVDRAQAELYDVTERRTSEDYVILDEILQPTLDEIDAIASSGGRGSGIPTGYADLDALTNGLHPGQMVIIAGRPGMGKSTAAMDMARHAAIKHKMATVVFSLEMSKTDLAMRLLSAEGEIKLSQMRSGTMTDRDWQKIVRRMGEITDAPLFFDDSPNMTIMEIRAKARRLKQRHDLKLIVVDYLQLMTSGKKVESRQQEVSEFSRQMKLLAKELELPVVALSQLNRGAEQRTDKRPMLSDLRESGSLEQDADVVILVHRPDAYDSEDRPGEADLMVVKHRNGETRTIPVAHQLHYSRFHDIAAGM
ncbi:MAG: replicative DNA helicase [Nakamurella sp.]